MLPDTRQYLDNHGFVQEEKIARSVIVQQLRDKLPVVDRIDDVDGKAALVIHLREQVLGASGNEEIDKELNYLVGDLLSVAPDGRMQRELENGYVLCSVRVKRSLNGEEPTSKSARFISGDPDVVEQFSQTPAVDRAVKAAKRANDVIEMGGKRIPILATRRPVLARKAQEQLALAMPLES